MAAIASSLTFLVSLALIFSERVNRTIVAVTGAALMVIFGRLLGFYTEEQARMAIDFNTLGLLLGMMILVSLLQPTGFFQYMAIQAGKLSRGKPVRLLVLLGTVTTILSMFLDNVTTVVMIAPITILISEILGISPIPLLMAEALLSNTGGVATLIGDPPNILIGSAAGLTFNDFLAHSLPVVVFVWLAALIALRRLFRRELDQPPLDADAINQLNAREALTDVRTARRVLIVLGAALLLFFGHSRLQISPALVALAAAAAALLWTQPPINDTLSRVEWSVLLFFSALFVLVGGLEASGVLGVLVGTLKGGGNIPPVLFGLFTLWLVAGLSAVVDNVPVTIALIPVIQGLGEAGMNAEPLWWALAFGAGFGGNGTIIGSTANIVVASFAENLPVPITPKLWHKRGLPVMLITCSVASLLFVILYPLLTR